MVFESNAAHRPWLNLEQIIVHLENQQVTGDAIRNAWIAAAELHPSLRASIDWRVRSQPQMTFGEHAHVDLEELDWQDMTTDAQAEKLEHFLSEDRQRGVDLEASPCWRVTLIHLGKDRSIMVWTIHHAQTDGRSMAIVLEDVFSFLDTGAPVSTVQSAIGNLSYPRMSRTPPESAEAFFKEYLGGFDPLVLSPEGISGDDARRKVQLSHLLDADVTARLNHVAKDCGGTLNNLVQAAWGLLLSRWYNVEDIVFGVVRSGRHGLAAPARATGCFINALPMRMKPGRNATLGALVGDLRRDTLAMHPFEQVPVTEIRRMCGIHGAAPLFDTVVMFERGTLDTLMQKTGATWANRRVELREESDMPISLSAYADTEMQLVLQFDPGILTEARAARMIDHLGRLLATMAKAKPDTPLHALNMLGDVETAGLLALGRPEQDPAEYFDPVEQFRAVVARAPDAIAVQHAGEPGWLSYAELDRRSDALSAALREHGAAPGEIVAIRLGRSTDYIVSLLAVLKSGAAFLPVDPSYPDAVIAHMLTDSAARLVISDTDTISAADTVVVSPSEVGAGKDDRTSVRAPADPAYVIYTSGSTGTPKGVVVPTRALAAHAAAITRAFDLRPEDRVLQFASLSFDVSIEEIVPTLLAGATLVLRSEASANSARDFLQETAKLDLTVMNLPTAFFHILTEYLTAAETALPATLRQVIVGGERIHPHILRDWLRAAPDVRWLNGYGPTETAITCTLYDPAGHLPEGDVPIGKATDHALLYVVAPDGSLSPRGTMGELWIGGPAVSDGYLGRPEQTAETFLADHFRGDGRLYRSGDRAAWRADGNLDFFGRDDRQVKMRGFRIDLGHVERVLEAAVPGLNVVAAVRDPNAPSARLLAWAKAPDCSGPLNLDALIAAAEAELPPAMRPQIIEVAELPRTAGGKIDIAALPDPKVTAKVAPDAPMTELEAQIAALMTKSLGGAPVGPDDDFYNLGGHSLLAAELVGRVETELKQRISILDLRNHPTPRGLAKVVQKGSSGPRHIFPIQPNGSKPPLFAVHILGGWDSYYTALAEELGPDQPLLGVTIGTLSQDKPTGIEATAKCYFDEIQKFYPDGPINLAAVSLGAYFAWELARQLRAAGREIGMLFLFDAAGPAGRDSVSGLTRMWAGYRTLKQRGFGAVPRTLYNRMEDLKYRSIAKYYKRREEKGLGIEIRSGDDFIAANEAAVDSYDAVPVDVPLTIFRSSENLFDTEAAIEDGLGWRDVALAGCKVQDVPGGHLTMLERPHVTTLASHMSQVLNNRSVPKCGITGKTGKSSRNTVRERRRLGASAGKSGQVEAVGRQDW